MARNLRKPPEGAKLPETADMKAWREEFDEMDTATHLAKLKEMGLDDEELEEFKEMKEAGVPLEEEIMHEGPALETKKKKVVKKK